MTHLTPDAGVRAGRPDDAPLIGQVQARAWRAAYPGLLAGPDGQPPHADALTGSWADALTRPPSPEHRVLVATAGPAVVGFAALSPATDADADAGTAEILTLLVDPGQQRHGHGSRLLNACADTSRERGFTVLRTWVPEPDTIRITFLEHAGFAADGAVRVLDAAGDGVRTVREVRLATAVGTDG